VRITLGFDPRLHQYGDVTASVHAILQAWCEVDWFEPSRSSDEAAATLFRQHHARAYAHAPDIFAADVEIRFAQGSWSEFGAWCDRVRNDHSWDWKFSALKAMSFRHAKARGWSREAEARNLPVNETRPGDLLVRFSAPSGAEIVMWNGVPAHVEGLDERLYGDARDHARFYVGFAHSDVIDCLEWQMAEGKDALDEDPFWPLLGCYRAGLYPFSLDRGTVVLFRFVDGPPALPRARLLRRR